MRINKFYFVTSLLIAILTYPRATYGQIKTLKFNNTYPCYIADKQGEYKIACTGIVLKSSAQLKFLSYVTDDGLYYSPGVLINKENKLAKIDINVNKDVQMYYYSPPNYYDLTSAQTLAFKELIKPELRKNIINFKSNNFGCSVVFLTNQKQLVEIDLYGNKYIEGYIKKIKKAEGFNLMADILNNAEYTETKYEPEKFNNYQTQYITLSEQKKFRSDIEIVNDDNTICFSYIDFNFNRKVEIFDLNSGAKINGFDVKDIYLIKDLEIENDTIYLLVVKPYKDLNEFELFIQKRFIDGRLLNEFKIDLPDSKTDSYTTMHAEPYSSKYDITLSKNDILLAYSVTALFKDGIRHQGQNLEVYSKNGDVKYRNLWSLSHVFNNYACYSKDYLFVGSCDGFPSRSIIAFDINSSSYKENLKNFNIFTYPGSSGENYIYDSKILSITKSEDASYYGFFTTEYYPDFIKSSYAIKSISPTVFGVYSEGRNQLFYFKSDGKKTITKQLTVDLNSDINSTAILNLPNGNTIIHVLDFKKNNKSKVDIDKEPVKYNTIESENYDVKNLFTIEEYFMVVGKNGEIIHDKLKYNSKNDLYSFDQFYFTESSEYYSKLVYKNGEICLIKPIQKTNLVEVIKFKEQFFK